MFKPILIAACLALPVAAYAVDEKKPTEQQNKMTRCNKEAGEKKLSGDDRKKFMSECLSAGTNPQQNRMAACNKEAGEKKLAGDDRKKFMSDCLSAQKKAPAAAAQPAKSQQDRMTACNKTAGEKALKGDDRKKFMKECLSA